MPKKKPAKKTVEMLKHAEASRLNIPTAEHQSVMDEADKSPVRVAYERRNRDLDPQLVWRGKDEQDWSDLVVHAPPLYIQEKVQPKVLIDDLLRQSQAARDAADRAGGGQQLDMFADFNGLPEHARSTDFYRHEAHWSNRLILGDSLQVMASLAEREGLRGQVQCIYLDPPYGIKFNSNFQWSTTSRDVKDGNVDHITREPEQVKAFRDTWRDGIHSYLTYLRDRLNVARDLLTESGSIFVQIGDENVHLVRGLLDEVFGSTNFVNQFGVTKTSGLSASDRVPATIDYILQYAKSEPDLKFRTLFLPKKPDAGDGAMFRYLSKEAPNNPFRISDLTKPGPGAKYEYEFAGRRYNSGGRWWGTTPEGMSRLDKATRLYPSGNNIAYVRYWNDYPYASLTNLWGDTGTGGFLEPKIYVVQTRVTIVERCMLLATDPGDLVLDPTCGSGTTAYVAEQWGRRWITIDTSRVALALARARIMGARYPYYLLADSREGQQKEAQLAGKPASTSRVHGSLKQGFVYERVPHITLKLIANNAEIDVIYERYQAQLEPVRAELNRATKQKWEEWEIPREAEADWSKEAGRLHAQWWELRIARQREIDGSIAAKADFEYLYDKPYDDNSKVRVAGPFTVESLSPHRVLAVDENDELIDPLAPGRRAEGDERGFVQMVLDNLKTSGVQQAHKEDKLTFTSVQPWPGRMVCAEGRYEGSGQWSVASDQQAGGSSTDHRPLTTGHSRAAIFVGPEFGTVSRTDLVAAAREAGDAGFDVLVACAFNYDAHSTEFAQLGRLPVLKARMNADLHMAGELKNTGKGNLFVIFGEPDIEIQPAADNQIRVHLRGVDVFHPNTGEVRSDGPEGIACWFIDTEYNEESFFVRQAYFLGAGDPYKALKTTLKAEINEEAWETLRSDTSRAFPKPSTGRIAVKVINHLGDEVMKVFRVE